MDAIGRLVTALVPSALLLALLTVHGQAMASDSDEALEPEDVALAPAADETTAAPPASTSSGSRGKRHVSGIHLDRDVGWSIGLEGYAGLTTLSSAEVTKGHAIAGGLARMQWRIVEIGATAEISDYAGERWRSLGGFAGAYFAFTNWVDIDVAVGLGLRKYVSTDLRYGSNGAAVEVPSLTFRLGLSDRPLETLLGPRLGAALLLGFDLKRQDVTWRYEMPGMEPIVGVTSFGGATAGLVMSVGLDAAWRGQR